MQPFAFTIYQRKEMAAYVQLFKICKTILLVFLTPCVAQTKEVARFLVVKYLCYITFFYSIVKEI